MDRQSSASAVLDPAIHNVPAPRRLCRLHMRGFREADNALKVRISE